MVGIVSVVQENLTLTPSTMQLHLACLSAATIAAAAAPTVTTVELSTDGGLGLRFDGIGVSTNFTSRPPPDKIKLCVLVVVMDDVC